MNYREALTFIQQKTSLGIQPGLGRILAVLAKHGNPQNAFRTVHVAGTNGKGTVAATIAEALQKSGRKTGLFTSPWVCDYREQIQINAQCISQEALARYVTLLRHEDLTEFELLCAVMYLYFADEGVEYAVIECGMGGRGDATNTERENLSVITAISLDHTDFLGNSIEEIAAEKAGILRLNGTCVLYNGELKPLFIDKCRKLITGNMHGNLDLVNAALKELGVPPVSSLVALPARQEKVGRILLDGGHNVAAAEALAPLLHNETALIAMMKDKDIEGYLSVVAPRCKTIICTTLDLPRAESAAVLADIAKDYCDSVYVEEEPREALRFPDLSLICGSFYLIRHIRKFLP